MGKSEKIAASGKKLVIVESPTKAKTIRKFLGSDYIVESCMGHIRDLPQSSKDIPEKYKKFEWAPLGVNPEHDFDPIYCIPRDKQKVVSNLKQKLAEASELYLATDEDREGESISWHLSEVLKPQVPTKRMVFNEITKEAIFKALRDTRSIDLNLVKAQEARRILDRLVGYSISPLLWKKIAYGLSAGRVQSVAVRLIVEREDQRLIFKKAKYCGISAELSKGGVGFEAKLLSIGQKRVATGKDFDGLTGQLLQSSTDKEIFILGPDQAATLSQSLRSQPWLVESVEEKPVARKPAAPFITSTLQQEANRKLGLSSRETMQVAQKLYEQGFITYMRTDSSFLSEEALKAARSCIQEKYGKDYLPAQMRSYAGKKVKGAQEAHEAIRPAGTQFQDPDQTGLQATQLKLYEMIWKRTVASQMVDAEQKQVSVRIQAADSLFSASGMTITFPGFLRAYVEGSDDPEADLQDREVRLPALASKDKLVAEKIEPTDHETKPPARYTEASLVQTMEKEGIGRPSTYASIIGTIIDRGYVRRAGTQLVPTFTAMVVSKLLRTHLSQFVDLGFTSQMEKSLDTIAEGDLDAIQYLHQVYSGKTGLKAQIAAQDKKIEPDEARSIHLQGLADYVFRVGKFGAYVCVQREGKEVCTSLPESESPADITAIVIDKLIDQKINGADALGKDPQTGLPIYALNGRFGPYVQLGEYNKDNEKPKRVSIPATIPLETLTLPQALELLSLPKTLGVHPVSGKDVKAGLGRFGPYVFHDGDYRSIPKTDDLFTISFARALELFAMPKKGRGRAAPLKEFGEHPQTGDPIQLMNGPYGVYLKCGKFNASLPEGTEPASIDLKLALEILASRIPEGTGRSAKSKEKSKAKSETKPKVKVAPKEKSAKPLKKETLPQSESSSVKAKVSKSAPAAVAKSVSTGPQAKAEKKPAPAAKGKTKAADTAPKRSIRITW
jgi:DNA topoisomerase-1